MSPHYKCHFQALACVTAVSREGGRRARVCGGPGQRPPAPLWQPGLAVESAERGASSPDSEGPSGFRGKRLRRRHFPEFGLSAHTSTRPARALHAPCARQIVLHFTSESFCPVLGLCRFRVGEAQLHALGFLPRVCGLGPWARHHPGGEGQLEPFLCLGSGGLGSRQQRNACRGGQGVLGFPRGRGWGAA